MKYKIELTYNKDIDKTIRYDNVAKNFKTYNMFYLQTSTPYPEDVDINTNNENFPIYDFETELENLYTSIISFFTTYQSNNGENVLLLDNSYTIKVSLLLSYNAISDFIITNINDSYIYEIYNNQLVDIKPNSPT